MHLIPVFAFQRIRRCHHDTSIGGSAIELWISDCELHGVGGSFPSHLGDMQRWDDGSGRINVVRSKTDVEATGAADEWLSLFDDPILGNSALDRLQRQLPRAAVATPRHSGRPKR